MHLSTTNIEIKDESTLVASINPPINKQSNQVSSSKKRKHNSFENLGSCIEMLAMFLESSMKKSSKYFEALVWCLISKEEDHQFVRDELKQMGLSIRDRIEILSKFAYQPSKVKTYKNLDKEEKIEFVSTVLAEGRNERFSFK